MGCGHSKINIYPRRSRNKNCNKKSGSLENEENEEEDSADVEEQIKDDGDKKNNMGVVDLESDQNGNDSSDKKTISVKPVGGPLLAYTELSNSQYNFFKMLDEKIENGADYDSGSESEKAKERARVAQLLREWEAVSSSSRSLPVTPKRRPNHPSAVYHAQQIPKHPLGLNETSSSFLYASTPIANYHVAPSSANYRQGGYIPVYSQYSQQMAAIYGEPSVQAPLPVVRYSIYHATPPHVQQYSGLPRHPIGSPPVRYNQVLSVNQQSSPKHVAYEYGNVMSSPKSFHKPRLANGDLIQQQIYQQQMQYQHGSEYQQFKQAREQELLLQQHSKGYQTIVHPPVVPQNKSEYYELT